MTCQFNTTAKDIEGPYYVAGSPLRKNAICAATFAHDRLMLVGRVMDCQGNGIAATLDLWQANAEGIYSSPPNYGCRAKDGAIAGSSPRYDDHGFRPAHIHMKVVPTSADLAPLMTQLYFENDAFLGDADSCSHCSSHEPSLIATLVHRKDIKTYTGAWDIVLSGLDTPSQPLQQPTGGYTQFQPHIMPGSFFESELLWSPLIVVALLVFVYWRRPRNTTRKPIV
ncbi:hypothetical protein HDU91_002680 [Kappamyces sp. JEL0680]|nr:hypothetical protein HDU91_002680 [Kappamyces sp. JEL0680]